MKQSTLPRNDEPTAEQIAQAESIDLSLIDDALRKSPEERLSDNSRVLATVEALQTALREQHGGA